MNTDRIALTVLVALTVAPATAAAETLPTVVPEEVARTHFERAERAFDLGRFTDALAAYESAYEVRPMPGFLFNIAQCQRNMGRPERALFFYERYLALDPETPNRAVVRELIRDMRRQLGEPGGMGTAPAAFAAASHAETPGPPARLPVYRRWWFWGMVGAAAGAGAAAAILATRSSATTLPRGDFPSIDARDQLP